MASDLAAFTSFVADVKCGGRGTKVCILCITEVYYETCISEASLPFCTISYHYELLVGYLNFFYLPELYDS